MNQEESGKTTNLTEIVEITYRTPKKNLKTEQDFILGIRYEPIGNLNWLNRVIEYNMCLDR